MTSRIAKAALIYLPTLRIFRFFFVGLAAEALVTAPGIRKSSGFLPPLIAAVSHRGEATPGQVEVTIPNRLEYCGTLRRIKKALSLAEWPEMCLQYVHARPLFPPWGSASTDMQRFHRSERDCELAAR
jgi:hypothetical protein